MSDPLIKLFCGFNPSETKMTIIESVLYAFPKNTYIQEIDNIHNICLLRPNLKIKISNDQNR